MHLVVRREKLIQVYHTAIFFSFLSVLLDIPYVEQFTQRKLLKSEMRTSFYFLSSDFHLPIPQPSKNKYHSEVQHTRSSPRKNNASNNAAPHIKALHLT